MIQPSCRTVRFVVQTSKMPTSKASPSSFERMVVTILDKYWFIRFNATYVIRTQGIQKSSSKPWFCYQVGLLRSPVWNSELNSLQSSCSYISNYSINRIKVSSENGHSVKTWKLSSYAFGSRMYGIDQRWESHQPLNHTFPENPLPVRAGLVRVQKKKTDGVQSMPPWSLGRCRSPCALTLRRTCALALQRPHAPIHKHSSSPSNCSVQERSPSAGSDPPPFAGPDHDSNARMLIDNLWKRKKFYQGFFLSMFLVMQIGWHMYFTRRLSFARIMMQSWMTT